MLQGACYSRPVYGHSHYKKFWLKKMESEGEQSLSPPGSEYSRASSERSGVFWKNRAAVGGNCPPLELKRRTSSTRLSTVRPTEDKPKEPSKQKLTILGGNDLECTLALGLQMPHTDGFPPLKRGAFRLEMGEEERKPLEQLECSSLTERSRDKILPGGLNDSQIGRSRADGGRYLHKVVEEYKDPDDGSLSFGNAFGTEEIGKEIYLASVNPPGGRAERLVEDGKGCGAVTRTCSHCKTANTPLWRNGPNGPKSLCNACGIRYKKIGRRCGGNGEQQRSAARSLVRQMAKRKQEADLSQSHPRKKSNTLAALRTVAVAPNNGESATCFARDEEEGAALLMGLSCGLANALA